MSNNKQEMHPLFPSGEWEGFYLYPPSNRKHSMPSILKFKNNKITGGGSDDVGTFKWTGTYDKEELKCNIVKQYATHVVYYQGNVDENGIWGHWSIPPFAKGGFHIWPKSNSSNHAKKEVKKKTKAMKKTKVKAKERKLVKK